MKPNIGLKTPHNNNSKPKTKPKWEIEKFRSELKSNGMLTRDSRKVERKKYGQPGARKKFQFSKR